MSKALDSLEGKMADSSGRRSSAMKEEVSL
jgi:hypothetical protein